MRQEQEHINEVGRRMAAAYVSYVAGHVGVDRILKRTPRKVGKLWTEIASFVFAEMTQQKGRGVTPRKLSTKYIQ